MMKTTSVAATNVSSRKIGALLGAIALSAVLLSGCSGESSTDVNNTTETSSAQEPDDSAKASADGMPEDFPEDVPLPEFTSVKKIGGESGPDITSDWWSIMVMLTSATETPVEDYAAQLSDAGYTVSTDSGTTEAIGPKWEISFHSSMKNTLTVGVMSK